MPLVPAILEKKESSEPKVFPTSFDPSTLIMAMSLSSGGGGLSGGGLSTAAMAYQAPGGGHSMPNAQSNPGVNMMRSTNIAEGKENTVNKLTPEELERMCAPVVALDFKKLDGGECRVDIAYSAPPSDNPVRIVPILGGFSGSLRLKGTVESYKALRKFDKKGYNIRGCYEKCVMSEKEKGGINVGGYCDIVKGEKTGGGVEYLGDGTVNVELSSEWEAVNVKTTTLLSLYIHHIVLSVLPPSLSAYSPIISICTPSSMGDFERTCLTSALSYTDALDSAAKGVRSIKKKEREGLAGVYTLTPGAVGAVVGCIHLGKGLDGVNGFIQNAVRRSAMKNNGVQETKVPPCVKEGEVPIFIVVQSTGGKIEVAGVTCEELQAMGKTKAGQPVPAFNTVKVIARSNCDSKESLGTSIGEVWDRVQRIYENRGVAGFLDNMGLSADGIKKAVGEGVWSEMKEFGKDPFVVGIPDEAPAVGVCLVANSGGEGRVNIGRSKMMRAGDVVGREVGLRLTCKGKTEVKRILEVGRYMPARHEVEFTASATAYWFEKGSEAYGEADEEGMKEYEGRKNMTERREISENLKVEIVQREPGRDGAWTPLPMVEDDGKLDYRPFRPLVFRNVSSPDVVKVCPCATFSLSMDSAGILGTKLTRSTLEIEEDVKAEEGGRRTWYWIMAVAILLAVGISWRSYHVTVVFDRRVTKLHTFYKYVNKTINPINEARYIVYEYNDDIGKLWEKLEKKYKIPVGEPSEYLEIIEERERIKEEERLEEERKVEEEKERMEKEGEREEL